MFGNPPVPLATRNALYLNEMLGGGIPVAQGADRPGHGLDYKAATHVDSPERFGSGTSLKVRHKQLDEPAAASLVLQARKHQGSLSFVPLSDIAEPIHLDR